jgi:hypothetical protein
MYQMASLVNETILNGAILVLFGAEERLDRLANGFC